MIRKLDRSEWRGHICDELWPVLERLASQYDIQISEVILDIKGVYTDAYMNARLTADILRSALGEPASGKLRMGEDWVGCSPHFCSIHGLNSSAAARKQRTFMARLKAFFTVKGGG